MKKILLIYYSQTGQTKAAMSPFIAALQGKHHIDICSIGAGQFSFPWKFGAFFRVFPDCIHQQATAFTSEIIQEEKYDLIILGWPVWFLSPALPITSFLLSEAGRIVKDTPVFGIATSRNMWFSASLTLKKLIAARGGRLIGGLSLCDEGPSWATFVTTPRWLLTGRRDRFLFFPKAGISEASFKSLEGEAQKMVACLDQVDFHAALSQLYGSFDKASVEETRTLLLEAVGAKYFAFWANLIKIFGKNSAIRKDAAIMLFRSTLGVTILALFIMMETAYLLWPDKMRLMASRYRKRLSGNL